jgi:HEPN domain-containing protein
MSPKFDLLLNPERESGGNNDQIEQTATLSAINTATLTKQQNEPAERAKLSAAQKFEYWYEVAQYDLETARAMLSTGRWLAVVFMCQQAIEKLVKGLYLLYISDDVPRIHDIPKIVKHFEDRLPEKISENYMVLFDKLSAYYLNNRYPEYKTKLALQTKSSVANEIMTLTEEAYAWLLTMKP